jgi:hypothetical protein
MSASVKKLHVESKKSKSHTHEHNNHTPPYIYILFYYIWNTIPVLVLLQAVVGSMHVLVVYTNTYIEERSGDQI